jgi:hypothetical protein
MAKGTVRSIVVPDDLERRVKSAVQFFWATRDRQTQGGSAGKGRDVGNRGAVTGGKQLDGFLDLLKGLLVENGVREGSIFSRADLELPGYYRPTKKWDLLVVDNGKLVVAVELKSHVGPSFGNNFNNRTEEAMGSALDLWTAYREGVFGDGSPWLGYLLLLEDCPGASAPVAVRSRHFRAMEEFERASYTERYRIFCNKLVLERQYSAACFVAAKRGPGVRAGYSVPSEGLSPRSFVVSRRAAVLAHGAV